VTARFLRLAESGTDGRLRGATSLARSRAERPRRNFQDGTLQRDALIEARYAQRLSLNKCRVRGIGFRRLSEALDSTTARGRLVFHKVGALAEFERTQTGLRRAVRRPHWRTPPGTHRRRYRGRQHAGRLTTTAQPQRPGARGGISAWRRPAVLRRLQTFLASFRSGELRPRAAIYTRFFANDCAECGEIRAALKSMGKLERVGSAAATGKRPPLG
jgi:hypothetical protein